jgi:hypothetical protein
MPDCRALVVLLVCFPACGPETRPPAAGGEGDDPGGAACAPAGGQVCVGGDAYACTASGTLGPLVTHCPDGCVDGACAAPGADCAGGGAEVIYVVTDDNRLMSFDPRNDAHVFTLVGTLSCPAGEQWPARGGGPSHPYSMSVDRGGFAWVLYTSGEIFKVSTGDASCQPTSWAKGTMGLELFGMAFVADAPGSPAEHLYVAGGAAGSPGSGRLAVVDPATLAVQLGGVLTAGEMAPELSGTGAAELYAYYPGQQSAKVARLERPSATLAQTWPMPAASGTPVGWAFAHWGGRFYVFVTEHNLQTITRKSRVYRLDPQDGEVELVLDDLPFKVVGAGVSTCAPVIVE